MFFYVSMLILPIQLKSIGSSLDFDPIDLHCIDK